MKFFIFIFFLFGFSTTYAQETTSNSNQCLLSGAIFKIEAKVEKSIKKLNGQIIKKLKCKLEARTPAAFVCVRGTQLIV